MVEAASYQKYAKISDPIYIQIKIDNTPDLIDDLNYII